jgi:hypothetical protein
MPREDDPNNGGHARRPYDDVRDIVVRSFLQRAGFSVDQAEDGRTFALLMGFLSDRFDDREEAKRLRAFIAELYADREESRRLRNYLTELYKNKDEDALMRPFLKGRFGAAEAMKRGRTRLAISLLGIVGGAIVTDLISSSFPGILSWLAARFH